MALNLGVHTVSVSATAPVTTAGINTQTSGSGIVIGCIWSGTVAFTSVTDSKSNTWTQVGSELSSTNAKSRFYKSENAVGGTGHTFTLNLASSTICTIFVVEITTTNGLGVITDQSGGQLSPTAPFNSPSLTTTIANEFLVGILMDDASAGTIVYTDNGPQGFTQIDTSTNANTTWTGVSAYKSVSATGTYHTSWTESGTGFQPPVNTHDWLITVSETVLTIPQLTPSFTQSSSSPGWYSTYV